MRVRRTTQQLEVEIINLETASVSHTDQHNQLLLESKREDLKSFLHERAKGDLVRARFTSLQDMDTPTSYFFSMSKVLSNRLKNFLQVVLNFRLQSCYIILL